MEKTHRRRTADKPLSKPLATCLAIHRSPNEPALLMGQHQNYQKMFREALNRSFILTPAKNQENT